MDRPQMEGGAFDPVGESRAVEAEVNRSEFAGGS